MRQASKLALLLIGIIAHTGLASQPRVQPHCTLWQTEADNIVNLRQDPEPAAQVLARLALGSTGIEKRGISRDGHWIEVRHGEMTGWISTRFLHCRYSPKDAEAVIGNTAKQVLHAIRDENWRALATHIHPDKGMRLSPFAYVDAGADQVIKADDFETIIQDDGKRVWGYEDGTGDPIRLSLAQYLEQYLRGHAYWKAGRAAYNQLQDTGNTADNILDVYPHAITVEYYLSGLDSATHGTTWSSLRLVFEKSCNRWYLVGIVHASWTI